MAALRDALGMTQRELASEFRVTSGAIAQWESGQKTIPGPVLQLISLYERDLAETSPERDGPWITRTTDLSVLGSTLVAQAMFASAPPSSIRARVRDRIFAKYVDTASRRRGLTMKWAQFIWALDPVLSAGQRDALRAFQSLGPSMTAAVAARVFFEEFGRTPRDAFAEWSPTPLASASLGQVHRATLETGEDVAVKIQHPDAAARMDADLEQLRLLEQLALVFMRNQKPGVIHEELRTVYGNECDYRIEAKNHRWMCRIFEGDPHVRVPQVIERFTSRRVITTSYAQGTPLETFARRASQTERDAAGESLWRFYFTTVLEHGTYNADPNPGNHLFAYDHVTFLDFGRVKRVSAEFHALWKRWLRAVFERSEDDAKRAMIEVGYVKDPSRFDFRHALALLWTWTWPCVVDRPFAFTPELLRHWWSVYAADTTRSSVDMHPDMAFLPHLMFGVGGLLTTLRARVRCRDVFIAGLYPDARKAPPPYSERELRRYGLVLAT